MMGGGQRSVRNVFDPMDLHQEEITHMCLSEPQTFGFRPQPEGSGVQTTHVQCFNVNMFVTGVTICDYL